MNAAFDAIKPCLNAIEIGDQRDYLEQMATVQVPSDGEPFVTRPLVDVSILFGNPLVTRHEFAWPHHPGLEPIRVRMDLHDFTRFTDARDGGWASYLVSLPDYE